MNDTYQEFIGLTLEELSDKLQNKNLIYRVVNLDGHPCIVTRDYRLDRLNIGVKDGLVISIFGLG